MGAALEWTAPVHGVTHCCPKGHGPGKHWATVSDRGGFADLSRCFPGCRFEPLRSTHATVEEAKQVAEAWLRESYPDIAPASAQAEAIANADAHTNNAGLPTYSELVEALRKLNTEANLYLPGHRLTKPAKAGAVALLDRIPH